jgi:hypothetical protein
MPPHCDSLDGPVVTAARAALDAEDVALVLPYVPGPAEAEVEDSFALSVKARTQGPEARDVAERWFFETVVRLHRAGEGASFTGLKPAGLDVGPVIPVAERAISCGDPGPLVDLLATIVREETERRFAEMAQRKAARTDGVRAAREYVSAMLGLQVWAHKLALAAHADPHSGPHHHQ